MKKSKNVEKKKKKVLSGHKGILVGTIILAKAQTKQSYQKKTHFSSHWLLGLMLQG